MMQHTNMLRTYSVALGMGGEEKCGKTYKFFFFRKGSGNNCIIVKSSFFFPTSNLLCKQDRVFSFLSDIAYFKCTKFLQVFCNLGQFCIKMWLPLQIYFPLAVTGKIFLYSILFLGTFWSMVPTKWHAVVPCRKRLNPWLINQHWARWWGLGGTKSVHAGDKFVELLLCQVWFYLIYYLLEFVSFNGNLRLLMFIMIIVFNLW